jgi:hypothetical protein
MTTADYVDTADTLDPADTVDTVDTVDVDDPHGCNEPDPLVVACEKRRRALGISVRQAARDLGIASSTLNSWKSNGPAGRQPRIREVRRYAEYVGLILLALPLPGTDTPDVDAGDGEDDPGCEIVTGVDQTGGGGPSGTD